MRVGRWVIAGLRWEQSHLSPLSSHQLSEVEDDIEVEVEFEGEFKGESDYEGQ